MSKCLNIPIKTEGKHGKTIFKSVHNGEEAEPVKFDPTKGDLTITIVHCDEVSLAGDPINMPDEAETRQQLDNHFKNMGACVSIRYTAILLIFIHLQSMTKAEVITQINNVCSEIGANAPLMLAFASAESSFNPNAGKGKTYVGLYQLSNGYGGCNGDDRMNIRLSTIATWKQIQANKARFVAKYNTWQDCYAYGMHQQGVAGFMSLHDNPNAAVSSLASGVQQRINGNMPKNNKPIYVRDFLNYWQNRINGLMEDYGHVPLTFSLPEIVITEVREAAKSTPLALTLSLLMFAATLGYVAYSTVMD